MAILEIRDIFKDFDGLRVLTGISLSVEERERFAVIGPNGAGKTTLFNIVSGKFRPSSGTVMYDGDEITRAPMHQRNRRGLSRSFQITNVFQNLSVFDNVLAGVCSHAGLRYNLLRRPHRNQSLCRRTEEILEEVGLWEFRQTLARELAYGQQRALELAITLSTEPRLVLLDEPTAGMSRQETEEAIRMVRRVTERMACMIIEHDMNVVFSLAERIAVLHYGMILACGRPEDIRQDQRVKDAYLGEQGS
ncbi:MAG: ABC transporter ATP-binding protein [Deltaproteobacteria bacterium]|nr:ABC transporter ATP-binding protein [Deltaproteobacteria bacterium]